MFYTYEEKKQNEIIRKREAEIEGERMTAIEAAQASIERERQARLKDAAIGLTEESLQAKLDDLQAADLRAQATETADQRRTRESRSLLQQIRQFAGLHS
jgi:hypothetical protein